MDQLPDPIFKKAVTAIDMGAADTLKTLIDKHPELVATHAVFSVANYFSNPHLLWFIANNPIRTQNLADNILEITLLIVDQTRSKKPELLQAALNYTLGLVISGSVVKAHQKQIPLIDLLIREGASPGNGIAALMHGNLEACSRLLDHGGELTLATAVVLELSERIEPLLKTSSKTERQKALAAAAFYGNAKALRRLLQTDIDIDEYNPEGFHSHSVPLHQAVFSGSLDAVKVLVDAGSNLHIKDTIYAGTPLDWAYHALEGSNSPAEQTINLKIIDYIKEKMPPEMP